MNKEIHIIAEAGTNHNGNVERARELIDVADEAKANSVKFQIIYPEGLYLPKFFRDERHVDNEVFLQRKKWMLSDDTYRYLASYCKEKGILFSASVFDKGGVDLVDELDVEYVKIASCDLNNSSLLKLAAETGRKIIVSTGMATLGDIERAVADITSTGNTDLVLMHCVSLYPCPFSQMNLGFIDVLKTCFGFSVGFSDHTENNLAAAIAVSKGVEYLEKHFTLNRTAEGFDHAYAMEPDGLAKYVADVRACEAASRLQFPKVSEPESAVKLRARRGLYAARDIPAGDVLVPADILAVRPEGQLCPNDIECVLGKRARRRINQYESISWDLLE